MQEFEIVEGGHDEPAIGQNGWEHAGAHESWWNTKRTDRDLVVELVAGKFRALYFDATGRHEIDDCASLEEAQQAAEQAE